LKHYRVNRKSYGSQPVLPRLARRSERGTTPTSAVWRLGAGNNAAATDRASQTRCDFGTIVFDTGSVEASKGCLESRGVHRIRGTAITEHFGDRGWHFLLRKAEGALGESKPCSGRQSRTQPVQQSAACPDSFFV
jgi:hypothetical protein